jgi:pimeloyl-ACP methyl ester carboxylesterase
MNVYFISGLAADNRAFQFIELPPGFETHYIDWITPIKNESLREYALRLASNININEPFILVGLSMGGMIATEIARKYQPAMTILISSSRSHKQFPPWFKLAAWLRLQKAVPAKFFKSASLMKRLFTSETKEVKNILRQVIKDSDPVFIKWALTAILQWKNEEKPMPLVQIHGTKDELLPIRYCQPDHIIKNGSHLMVMSRAGELNILLQEILLPVQK